MGIKARLRSWAIIFAIRLIDVRQNNCFLLLIKSGLLLYTGLMQFVYGFKNILPKLLKKNLPAIWRGKQQASNNK
jgi:hypothetical protein